MVESPGNGCGTEHVKSTPIYCKDNNGVVSHFAGIRDAARVLHVDSSGICKVLKGETENVSQFAIFLWKHYTAKVKRLSSLKGIRVNIWKNVAKRN